MRVFLVAEIEVLNPEVMKEYARLSRPLAEKHGGVYHVRGGDIQSVEGEWRPQRIAIIEFPSRSAANAYLDDSDYLPVAELRRASAITRSFLVDGLD